MPINKDFKRLVRARMARTGEAYTAARANLLNPSVRRRPAARPRVAVALLPAPGVHAPGQFAAIAGMSDESVKKATGCNWANWVKSLDYHRAWEWPHAKIVKFAHEKYKTPSWWSQMVVVGYERIRGLRERGQRRDAGWEITKSRVLRAPLKDVYAAFSQAKRRAAWLPDVALKVGKITAGKYWRATWPDNTSLVVNFYAKGAGKSQVQVQHEKLTSKDQAVRLKTFWSERLDALGAILE